MKLTKLYTLMAACMTLVAIAYIFVLGDVNKGLMTLIITGNVLILGKLSNIDFKVEPTSEIKHLRKDLNDTTAAWAAAADERDQNKQLIQSMQEFMRSFEWGEEGICPWCESRRPTHTDTCPFMFHLKEE